MPRPKYFLVVGIVAVVFAFATPAFAQEPPAQQAEETPEPANVAGEWVITMDTMEAVLNLTQEGLVLAGTISSDQGTLDLEGEVEGNEVVFWGYFEDFSLSFYATVAEDKKTMQGTLEAGGGEFVVDFMAVKVER